MGYVLVWKFLNRLSKSKHKTNFVFKGGFLLGSIVGIEQRTTFDIAKGDVVTPNPVLYNYKSNITETNFDILAYSK